MISFRLFFFQWSYHKKSARLCTPVMVRKHLEFSLNSIYLLSTILCFTIHYIYRTSQAAMCNYLLVKKKIWYTNSVHARLKEITDNLYWIFSPFYKLLNYNFWSVIHSKNKIECDVRFFALTGPLRRTQLIAVKNSSIETTCSGNGNSSQFPGARRPASSELATDVKDETAFGSVTLL